MTELELLTKIAIVNGNTLAATSSVIPATADPPKKRLVARWLIDEISKLYCQ